MGLNSGTSALIAIISYLALSLYLTLFWIAFIVSTHFIPKKMELFLTPLSWIFFVEFLRNIGPLAGPWMNLSLTQSEYIRIIQLASIETHAISFIIISDISLGELWWTLGNIQNIVCECLYFRRYRITVTIKVID